MNKRNASQTFPDRAMMQDAAGPEHAEPPKPRVFISYSRKDMAFAGRLEAALAARGFEPLIDRTEIYAFEEWWARIEALIVRADTVVFVLSPDSVVLRGGAERGRVRRLAQQAVRAHRLPPRRRRTGAGGAGQAQFRVLRRRRAVRGARRPPRRGARHRHCLDPAAHRVRRAGAALGAGRASHRIAAALAGAGAGGALDRHAAARRADADRGNPRLYRCRAGAPPRAGAMRSPAVSPPGSFWRSRSPRWRTGSAASRSSSARSRERNEALAKEERDRATRNFKLAQKTAESLVFDIAQGLRDVQGMRAESVRKILETAKATFEQLAAGAADDPGLQRSRVGDAQRIRRHLPDPRRPGAGAERLPRWPRHRRSVSPQPIPPTPMAARSVGIAHQARRRAAGAGQTRRRAQGLSRRPRHQRASRRPSSGNAQSQHDLAVGVRQARRSAGGPGQARSRAQVLSATPSPSASGSPPTIRQSRMATRPVAVVQQDRRRADGARQARRGAQILRNDLAIAERSSPPIPPIRSGSAICRCRTTRSATC